MKKKISIIIMLVLCLIPLTGCFNKEKIDSNKLREKLEDKGFTVVEYKEELTDFPGDSALLATKNSGFAIMIMSFPSVDVSESSYEQLCKQAEEENSTKKTVNVGNYSEYTLESKKNYYYILRVDDKILMAYGSANKKSDIKKILEEIGY